MLQVPPTAQKNPPEGSPGARLASVAAEAAMVNPQLQNKKYLNLATTLRSTLSRQMNSNCQDSASAAAGIAEVQLASQHNGQGPGISIRAVGCRPMHRKEKDDGHTIV